MKNKNIVIITIILLSGLFSDCDKPNSSLSGTRSTCLTPNLQNDIIAFYPFSAGSINDFSGNNNHLINTTSASPGADRNGNDSCAFNFISANGDYLKFDNPTFIDNIQVSSFSISLWYKPLGIRSYGKYELLIGRDSALHCPDTYGQWSVGLFDCRRAVFGINEFSIWDNYVNSNGCNYTMSDLSDIWQHLVVTCNGTSLKIYRNGILTTLSAGTGCNTVQPTINTGTFFLGKEYTGLLDDIIIYKKILSQSEINQLYNLQPCCE